MAFIKVSKYTAVPPTGAPAALFQVKIAMVGKYTNLADAYLSVIKSLQHACLAANRKLDILWVEASHLEPQTEKDDADAFKVNPTLQENIPWNLHPPPLAPCDCNLQGGNSPKSGQETVQESPFARRCLYLQSTSL